MILGGITFQAPLTDASVPHLNAHFSELRNGAVQHRSGTYIGTGIPDLFIEVGVSPVWVAIMPSVVGPGNMVFGFSPPISFIPGTGVVDDAITSFDPGGFVLGLNPEVNTLGVEYTYFILG